MWARLSCHPRLRGALPEDGDEPLLPDDAAARMMWGAFGLGFRV